MDKDYQDRWYAAASADVDQRGFGKGPKRFGENGRMVRIVRRDKKTVVESCSDGDEVDEEKEGKKGGQGPEYLPLKRPAMDEKEESEMRQEISSSRVRELPPSIPFCGGEHYLYD